MCSHGGERVIASLLPLNGHSIRAVLSALPYMIKKQVEQELLVMYITECLRHTSKNTATHEGCEYVNISFNDLVKPKSLDNRTGDQIVDEVLRRIGVT